jgi:hypothetical protein
MVVYYAKEAIDNLIHTYQDQHKDPDSLGTPHPLLLHNHL